MEKPVKIAFTLPAYGGQISANQAATWLSLGRALGEAAIDYTMIVVDCNGVQRARNTLVAHAMATGCDWILMIDDDTWIEGDDPGRAMLRMMMQGLLDHGAAIVAAPVRRRGADGVSVYDVTDEGKLIQIGDLILKSPRCDVPKCGKIVSMKDPYGGYHCEEHGTVGKCDPDFIEVAAIGASIIGIDLHKIGDATFAFTDTRSEDLEFCRQVIERGGRILVDVRVKTAHLGMPSVLRY